MTNPELAARLEALAEDLGDSHSEVGCILLVIAGDLQLDHTHGPQELAELVANHGKKQLGKIEAYQASLN